MVTKMTRDLLYAICGKIQTLNEFHGGGGGGGVHHNVLFYCD